VQEWLHDEDEREQRKQTDLCVNRQISLDILRFRQSGAMRAVVWFYDKRGTAEKWARWSFIREASDIRSFSHRTTGIRGAKAMNDESPYRTSSLLVLNSLGKRR
jgi:hypothetical protein